MKSDGLKLSTLHYIRCNGVPEMINIHTQAFPVTAPEERPATFPKFCHKCGGDELKFSRAEDYKDGNLIRTYKIHHVLCVSCHNDTPEYFEWRDNATTTACSLCLHSCDTAGPGCAHPKSAIRMGFKPYNGVYNCKGFVLDCTSGKTVTVPMNTPKSEQLIDAKYWLELDDGNFIGDHDWDHEEPEEMNAKSIQWYERLIEAGAERVLVEAPELDDANYRTGLIVEVSSAELTCLMNVMCFLTELHPDETSHTYNPGEALFKISIAWIS